MSVWSRQAIMCCDLFQMPPAVPIDILQGNHSQCWSVQVCISTSSTINMRVIEREYTYVRKIMHMCTRATFNVNCCLLDNCAYVHAHGCVFVYFHDSGDDTCVR